MKRGVRAKHRYYNNQWFARWARLYDYEKFLAFPIRRKAAGLLGQSDQVNIGKITLIDVATGTGSQAFELAKLGYKVTGIDLSPEMLRQAQKKSSPPLELEFKQADATTLPFENGYFDKASISFGLHDMPHDIRVDTLEEIKRVTKPGGEILIVDYLEPSESLLAKLAYPLICIYETDHFKDFILRGLSSYLEDAELEIVRRTNFWRLVQIVVTKNPRS